MANKQEKEFNPFEGCVLDTMSKEGKFFNYTYPDNGLPKTKKGASPAWSALVHYAEKCRQESES